MKASLARGTRDFFYSKIEKRNFIFNILKKTFKKYGFLPIETPAFERLETLMGKYGEEGDRLIFKILKSGDFLEEISDELLKNKNLKKISNLISDKALRYDLTIPFARFVVQHKDEIVFPFKRYQIQKVWRADRPQKGRYREFYQCDVDIIGSKSLFYEAELIQIYDDAFFDLGLSDVVIKINHRKILSGIAKYLKFYDKFNSFTTILDKIDKIGWKNVAQQLKNSGFEENSINSLSKILKITDIHSFIEEIPKNEINDDLLIGIKEIKEIFSIIDKIPLKKASLEFDLSLVRGLDYYTGTIFEVKKKKSSFGSIGGGGRYDNLCSMFGLNGISGVGISFGAERIFDIMEEEGLLPFDYLNIVPKFLFVNFEENALLSTMKIAKELRKKNISVEIYPEKSKIKKQLKYANNKKIPYVCIIGSEELKKNTITVKNLITGKQESLKKNDFLKKATNDELF